MKNSFFYYSLLIVVFYTTLSCSYFISSLESSEKLESKKSFQFHGNTTIVIEYPCSSQIFIKLFVCDDDAYDSIGCIETKIKKNYLLNNAHIFLGANNERQWDRILETVNLISEFHNLHLLELVYSNDTLHQIHLELKDKVFRKHII